MPAARMLSGVTSADLEMVGCLVRTEKLKATGMRVGGRMYDVSSQLRLHDPTPGFQQKLTFLSLAQSLRCQP